MESFRTFLDTIAIYGQPKTVASYGFWLTKFQAFVRKPVGEVTAGDVARWVALLKLKYAPLTVTLAVAIVKEYLHDFAPQINTRRIRQPKAHAEHPSDAITPEEYVSMLSFIRANTKKGVRDNLIIRLLYDSGARIGEITTLFEHREWIKEGFAVIHTEKTSDRRYIAWGKDTSVFLKTWLGFHESFPCQRQCLRIVTKYARLAKIDKKVSCHSFRHTKAHRILDNGGTVKDIQMTLGHRSPVSSFHYLNESDQENLVRQRRWVD
jgi:site-specific recombinase XerD